VGRSETDHARRERALRTARKTQEESVPDVTIVYWRDIPAQVIVGKGRRGSKVQLPERFEQAIDRCAMKIGARDTDSYLAEWRKAPPYEVEGDPDEVAKSEAARLEAEFDTQAIKRLIDNDGWAART
jgi:Virulence factor